MKRKPRGFNYTLEPLQRKCDWELHELQLNLAALNQKVADLEKAVAESEALLAAASADLAKQQGQFQVIYADKQKLAHTYITRQAKHVAQARKVLAEAVAERDQAMKALHRLQKFADGLEENRGDEIKDYLKIVGKLDIAEADDAWLRGANWRSKQ